MTTVRKSSKRFQQKVGGPLAGLFSLLLSFCCLVVASPLQAAEGERPPPKLVLQLTVDQLRGDLIQVHRNQFKQGGFRALTDQGFYYVNAHYDHANTETAIGHSSLFTGTYPAYHGVVANDMFDLKTGESLYCVGDKDVNILGLPKDSGASPKNLIGSTIGDELKMASPKSKIFGVSLKDRGAILPAGHLGKAFWYSSSNGEFVTSSYYYEDYPQWVKEWNTHKIADSYRDKQWELLHKIDSYIHQKDIRPFEKGYKHLDNKIPKKYMPSEQVKDKDYYTGLKFTPPGDEMLLSFAIETLKNEKLGQGDVTDFLSVSFSSNDYARHYFGPASLEAEDILLRLDQHFKTLFDYVDKTVGLENTLIILSADHGGGDSDQHMKTLGYAADRLDPDQFIDGLKAKVRSHFKVEQDLIKAFFSPYIYLDNEAIAKNGLKKPEVEQFIADEVMKEDTFLYAVTRTQLLSGNYPKTDMHRRILNNFHPKRSGDIYLLPEQFFMFYHQPYAGLTANHPFPWTYDTFVPVIFAGNGIKAQKSARLVRPYDIAATIASWLGIKPPSGSVGVPLYELLHANRFQK